MKPINRIRLICLVALIVLTASAPQGVREPVVLAYHLIMDVPYTENTELFVTNNNFSGQVRWFRQSGYMFLFADEYALRPEKSVILTFDDGYEDSYLTVLPILEEYDAKATVFLNTDSIGQPGHLTGAQIRKMAGSGRFRFGSHTAAHPHVKDLTCSELEAEFEKSKLVILELTGDEANTLAWPYGEYTEEAISIAKKYFHLAFKADWANSTDLYSIPRLSVKRSMTMEAFVGEIMGE